MMINLWLDEKEFKELEKKYPVGFEIDYPKNDCLHRGVLRFWAAVPKEDRKIVKAKFIALIEFEKTEQVHNSIYFPPQSLEKMRAIKI